MDGFLENISAKQLNNWRNYFSIYRFNEERSDYRMGVMASLLANIYRDNEVKTEPFKPIDFFPKFENIKKIHKIENSEEKPESIMFKLGLIFRKGG